MEADTLKSWGGIMMRNGMHSGLVAVKSDKSSINSGFSISSHSSLILIFDLHLEMNQNLEQ